MSNHEKFIYERFQEDMFYPLDEKGFIAEGSEPIARMKIECDGKLKDILPRIIERMKKNLEWCEREGF